eukprot:Skav227791  [mRNA]  locus=scaffold948:26557:28224:+ [translate_table: standard]
MADDGETQASESARRDRPSRRTAESGINGLPVFCRSRHFNRSANVYCVPLWDFTSRWLPDELKAYEVTRGARSTFAPEKRSEGKKKEDHDEEIEGEEENGEEEGGNSPDAPSDSEQSEIAWEGPLGGASRAWFRGAVDSALVLLRRLQLPGEGAASYALGVSAALIPPETVAEGADSSMDKRLAQIIRTREPRWAVCALRSGHFAGAIFKGQEAVVHKAIHRYTVRAKAGGAQSSCDSGKKVKSVGSSLRRYGEQRLAEEIKELLTEKWADQLADYELILVSVSKRMKSTLLGTEKEPFLPATHRIRKLPFMIGKPTFEAVQSAYLRAASVVFCEERVADQIAARFKPAKAEVEPETTTPEPKVKQEVPEETPVEAVKYSEEEDDLFTALHAACLLDDVDAIIEELDNGASPEARDGKGRVPYYLCSSQAAREAFRRWRGANEDAWDWTAAQVPEGITQETEQRKRDKEKEKRKKQKEKQKANKAKAKEEEEERLQKEEEERKMLEEAQAKCDKCKKPLVAKPFTRLNYLYCSPVCVNDHRRDLQAEAALKRLAA